MVPFGRLSYGGGAQPRATMFGRDEIAVDLFDAGIGFAVRVVHRDEQGRRRAGTIPDAHFEPPLALRLLTTSTHCRRWQISCQKPLLMDGEFTAGVGRG